MMEHVKAYMYIGYSGFKKNLFYMEYFIGFSRPVVVRD
jgi:hypothetical protein